MITSGNDRCETHGPVSRFVTYLECAMTGERNEPGRVYNLSRAGKPLLVRYDLAAISKTLTKDALAARAPDLWRYLELLPIRDAADARASKMRLVCSSTWF